MPAAWFPFVLAPAFGFLALAYAARPHDRVTGAWRLAAVRAALVTGAFAVLTVEVLGTFGRLTAPYLGTAWSVFLIGTVALAWWRTRRQPWSPSGGRLRSRWRAVSRGERLMIGTIAGLVLVELFISLLAEPNNFDSQTYHLPKVERWAAQGSLDFWPTAIHRQVTIPPGVEYLLLHLRLLTGGDALHNLVQWAAGLGVLLVVSRIAAQLGGGRRAQVITAFVVATTPMVALQATSTQTDLVAAAWTGCVATLALDGLRRPASAESVLALGAATGLTALTKTSGLLGVGPLLVLWGVAQLRLVLTGQSGRSGLVGLARVAGTGAAVLVVAAVVTGPFLARVSAEFGHPLGPPRLRESIPTQRHDPASVVINGLRVAHTALDTPLSPVRDVTAAGIEGLADLLGVDPQDRAITFGQTTFPVPSWYPDEDRVAFPIAGVLALIGGSVALVRPRRIVARHSGTLRAYAGAVAAALLLYATMIKWQPWGNRLLLFALVLAAPLAGLWLAALLHRHSQLRSQPTRTGTATNGTATTGGEPAGRPSIALLATVAVLATSALSGVLAISYGFPRRLVGTGSLLTTEDWETRFLRRPQWAEEFQWAAAAVQASEPRRVGLVQQNDNWEYPWWLLFRNGSGPAGPEIVALQSVLPQRPPADPRSVDAIVCTGDRDVCARFVPSGWRIEFRDYVGYALPPVS